MGLRVVILDGYTDEPAGLGVPPYIDIYPRYIAGAVWSVQKSAEILYFTIDSVRPHIDSFLRLVSRSDLLIVIAGVVVPGRYVSGKPITFEETISIAKKVRGPIKFLVGPAARFGFGYSGGRRAISRKNLNEIYDVVVYGDPEIVIHNFLLENKSIERINPYAVRRDYRLVDVFAIKGAKIVLQHPNLGFNLTAEIETYRGCPRWISGGCSFCIEPRFGRVVFRKQESIAREIAILYSLGVKSFRLGRQADFLAYKGLYTNYAEYPKPNVEALEKLFRMIRLAAPSLETLHIDNVNPMSIALHRDEAVKAIKTILKWHTPGDVAAFGLESADPIVIKYNNLGNDPDLVFEAIKILNEHGKSRGWNGMPELLPGINFVLGLKGESRKTFELNRLFLQKILEDNLLVRRVNIREVLPLEGTPMWNIGEKIVRKNKKTIISFKKWVREYFDVRMMKKLFPKLSILRRLYVEKIDKRQYIARQPGSYPIVVYVTEKRPLFSKIDIAVVGHKARSLVGVPIPLKVHKTSYSSLKLVFGDRVARDIVLNKNLNKIPLKYKFLIK